MATTCKALTLDIRGQICPSTLLTAVREVNQHRQSLKAGEVQLLILTDNRGATGTIPNAVENMGYPVAVMREDQHYRITIGGGDD